MTEPDIIAAYPDVLTVSDIAVLLRCSQHTAYELIRSGRIHAVMIGRQYRILKSELIRYLKS